MIALKLANVEIVGFAETNVDWSKTTIQYDTKKIITASLGRHTLIQTSSSSDTRGTTYLPGGTATILSGKWSGRAYKKHHDKLGRWSSITLQGKQSTKLTIITAYQVNKNTLQRAGTDTAWKQQYNILRLGGMTNPDPRREFIKDLTQFIQTIRRDNNHEIILMMDANENPTDPNNRLTQLALDTNLVDLHLYKHGSEGEPRTYQRGRRRIDFIWGTACVAANTTRAGITAFGETVLSDHRGLFIDIDLAQVLAGSACSLTPIKSRAFYSTSPTDVKNFRSSMIRYLEDHRVEERIKRLAHSNAIPEAEFIRQLEAIDNDVSTAMSVGRKQVSRKNGLPWSGELIEARQKAKYWQLWVKEINTGIQYSNIRQRLRAQFIGIEPQENQLDHRPTLQEAISQRNAARSRYRRIRKNAHEIRKHFLETRAKAEAISNNQAVETILRRIIQAEESKEDYTLLRRLLGKIKSGGFQSLLVPTEQTDNNGNQLYKRIVDQAQIENRLFTRNQAHFGQAHGTPFTVPPLSNLLGWHGTGAFAESILDGSIDIDTLDTTEATKTILKLLKRPRDTTPINPYVSGNDFHQGFKVWKEETSTSPSGQDLSQYKAFYKFPKNKKTEDDEPTEHDRLFHILASIANLATQQSYPLKRWRKVVNAMIEKIKGQPRIEKLRVIHLYEADMNLLLGELWGRRLQRQGEINNNFGSEQWGSREGKSSIDVALLKVLSYNIAELTRTILATFDNDAKACYDRIVVALANLRSQQLGMPTHICQFLSELLQKLEFHLKTGTTISDKSYSSTDEAPIYGTGQGSKTSPPIWIIVSSLLMEAMQQKATGAYFCDPQQKVEFSRRMDGFVDDTTVWSNRFLDSLSGKTSIEDITQDMTIAAQWWEQLLHASGGKLELPKCFFYMVSWVPGPNGTARIATPSEINVNVTITQSDDNQEININHKDCYDSHRTLGVMLAPTGDQSPSFNQLLDKANNLGRHLSTGNLTPRASRRAYQSVYLGSMKYVLPATNLTQKQLTRIQQAPITALLNGMGYNRHMPRVVVYGPTDRMGMGFQSLYGEQGVLKMQACIKQIRTQQPVGKMLIIGMKWFQQRSGQPISVFQDPNLPLPFTEGSWFHGLRQQLAASNSALFIPEIIPTTLRRQHDKFLVPDLLDSKLFDRATVEAINAVRIYLQVECLSDISTPEGDRLDPGMWHLNPTLPSRSNHLWPHQQQPDTSAINAWRKFLLFTYTKSTDPSGGLFLKDPLGPWIDQHLRTWPCYYDIETGCIACRQDCNRNDQWSYFDYRQAHSSIQLLPHPTFTDEFPAESYPITAPDNHGKIRTRQTDLSTWTPITEYPSTRQPISFRDYLDNLPEAWERDLLSRMYEMADAPPLCEVICSPGKLYMVSDGGAIPPTHGSFGVILANKNKILWKGLGIARGYPMQSFRAETYGRIAGLRLLLRYMEYLRITPHHQCSLVTYTDSLSLIEREFQELDDNPSIPLNPGQALKPDFDAMKILKQTRTSLRFNSRATHVRGHQDDTTPWHELTWPEQLNVHADTLATQALNEIRDQPCPLMIPMETTYLIHNNRIITSNETKEMRHDQERRNIEAYLRDKHQWTKNTLQNIAWDVYTTARKKQPKSRTVFLDKWIHDWLPVGKTLEKQSRGTSQCHQCQEIEDGDHILRCSTRSGLRRELIENLRKQLQNMQTDPNLQTEVIKGCQAWLNSEEPPESPQTEIGWRMLFRGAINTTWIDTQENYYKTQQESRKRFTGTDWGTKVVESLWNSTHDIWKARCKSLHDLDSRGNTQRDIEEAKSRAAAMYSVEQELLPEDRDLFAIPLEERTNDANAATLVNWVDTNWEVVKRMVSDARDAIRRNSQDIRRFLPRIQQQNTEVQQERTRTRTREDRNNTTNLNNNTTDIRQFFRRRLTRSLPDTRSE